ncbi:hypothetical protein [Selenomonas ruminantium]|uniref:hypothetical protein n=1 Tax=Selenomonas ruminantium TaxID=971 RepID=UPI0026EA9675|nr:hypothetical protein [Selenomonas ruminantium]
MIKDFDEMNNYEYLKGVKAQYTPLMQAIEKSGILQERERIEEMRRMVEPAIAQLERAQIITARSAISGAKQFNSSAFDVLRTAREIYQTIKPLYESDSRLKEILPPPPVPMDTSNRPRPAVAKKQRKRAIRHAEKMMQIINNERIKLLILWIKFFVEVCCPQFAPLFAGVEALKQTVEKAWPKPQK